MIFVIKQGENKSMKHANKRKTYANNGDAYENGIQRTGICTMVEVEEVFEVEEGSAAGDHGKKRQTIHVVRDQARLISAGQI